MPSLRSRLRAAKAGAKPKPRLTLAQLRDGSNERFAHVYGLLDQEAAWSREFYSRLDRLEYMHDYTYRKSSDIYVSHPTHRVHWRDLPPGLLGVVGALVIIVMVLSVFR